MNETLAALSVNRPCVTTPPWLADLIRGVTTAPSLAWHRRRERELGLVAVDGDEFDDPIFEHISTAGQAERVFRCAGNRRAPRRTRRARRPSRASADDPEPAPSSRARSRLRHAAYHEAGHAVIGAVLRGVPAAVVIRPNGTGIAHHPNEGTFRRYSRRDFDAEIPATMAGPVAEARIRCISLDDVFAFEGFDDSVAIDRLFENMPDHCGESPWERSNDFGHVVLRDPSDITQDNWVRFIEDTRILVRRHWHQIEAVANALLSAPGGKLSADEVGAIIAATKVRS